MENGFYMGLGVGMSKMDAPAMTINNQSATPDRNGMGGRVFMGGQFNRRGAFEMGYTHYAPATYNVKSSSGNTPELRISAIDFTFRGIFPVGETGIAFFGMPGLALASATGSGSLSPTGGHGPNSTSLRPKVGVGVSYELSQSWLAELAFQRMFGSGLVRSSSLLALSFSYHIVDLKCGQFLC